MANLTQYSSYDVCNNHFKHATNQTISVNFPEVMTKNAQADTVVTLLNQVNILLCIYVGVHIYEFRVKCELFLYKPKTYFSCKGLMQYGGFD